MNKIKIHQAQAICFAWLAKSEDPWFDPYDREYFGFGIDQKYKKKFLESLFALVSSTSYIQSIEIELSKQIEESPRSVDYYDTFADSIDDNKIEFSRIVFRKEDIKRDEEIIQVYTDFNQNEIIIIANINGVNALLREIYMGIDVNAVVFKNAVEVKYFQSTNITLPLNRKIFFWPIWDNIAWYIS